jgi:hypothetical protein
MVFEVLYPMFDFSDDNIHELVGIFETNGIEIRLSQSEINGLYETGCLMEHNCVPNVNLTFDKHYNVSTTAVDTEQKRTLNSSDYVNKSAHATAVKRELNCIISRLLDI